MALARHTPLSSGWALFLVVVAVSLALGILSFLFGMRVHAEIVSLFERLPDLVEAAEARWGIPNPLPMTSEYLSDLMVNQGMLGSLAGYTSGLLGILGSILLILVSGIYLAANPDTYRRGAALQPVVQPIQGWEIVCPPRLLCLPEY